MQNIDEILAILKREHKVSFWHKGFNYTIVETVVYHNESLEELYTGQYRLLIDNDIQNDQSATINVVKIWLLNIIKGLPFNHEMKAIRF
jgi:hypothetical protein